MILYKIHKIDNDLLIFYINFLQLIKKLFNFVRV